MILFVSFTLSCASSSKKLSSAESSDQTNKVAELRSMVAQLQSKIDSFEGKLVAVDGKIDRQAHPTPIYPHVTEANSKEITMPPSKQDPQYGFINDEAIDLFRKSLLLLRSQKHSEAILSFASFLEQYPDHVLAGSAQFHIGEAYLNQGEYKLAVHEFKRVLMSYDRNPHISETLLMLARAATAMNLPQESAKYRQQLTAFFPQSPAANQNGYFKAPESSTSEAPVERRSGLDGPPPTAPIQGGAR